MATDRSTARAAAQRAARAAAPDAGPNDDPNPSRFLRGLAIGALVGAAIAGSTIWQRHRVRGRIKRELAGDSERGRLTGSRVRVSRSKRSKEPGRDGLLPIAGPRPPPDPAEHVDASTHLLQVVAAALAESQVIVDSNPEIRLEARLEVVRDELDNVPTRQVAQALTNSLEASLALPA